LITKTSEEFTAQNKKKTSRGAIPGIHKESKKMNFYYIKHENGWHEPVKREIIEDLYEKGKLYYEQVGSTKYFLDENTYNQKLASYKLKVKKYRKEWREAGFFAVMISYTTKKSHCICLRGIKDEKHLEFLSIGCRTVNVAYL
jgi:hypothetical protein